MPTTFQILDAFAQDLEIQVETDTTREVAYIGAESDEDAEVQSRKRHKTVVPKTTKRKRMVIHLFGTMADGKSIRANVEGFEPFFYVRLPFGTKSTQQEFKQRLEFLVAASRDYSLKLADGSLDFEISFCKRKLLFGYTGGASYPFACLKVRSIAAWRALRSYFLDKECKPTFQLFKDQPPLEVFEANLDPMLRFFHLRNLQPCGWVEADVEAEETDTTFQLDCSWEEVSRVAKPPLPVAPFCLASWDIECYSENGEFPLPRKNYERIAKLLFAGGRDGAHAVEMLRQAALYPENPPEGMDGLYSKSGKIPKCEAINKILNELEAELEPLLQDREPANREEKIKDIHDVLKKLERVLPLAGDPVIQIGVVLQRGAAPIERHIFVLGTCDAVEGATVYSFATEREMILAWAKATCQWNTDILLGYNIFGFDERYVWIRAEELGIADSDDIQLLTRLADTGKQLVLDEKFLSSSALGDNTMYIWSAQGRLQIDLYHYVKRSYPLASYKLDDVCQHFMSGSLKEVVPSEASWSIKTKTTSDVIPGRSIVLLDETGDALVDKLRVIDVVKGSEIIVAAPPDAEELMAVIGAAVKWAMVKDDVSPQEIFKFHRGSSADRAIVAAYCIQDCILVLDLYKKLDVFNNAMAMANACSVPVGYIFTRGQGIKIESLIFKECHERGQVIKVLESPKQYGEGGQEESYEGAIVLDPIPGFYFDSPIGVADFASLYPSTIISENISYDTLVWVKRYSLDGKFLGYDFGEEVAEADGTTAETQSVRWTDIQFDIWGADPEDKRKHPAKIKTGLRICRFAQLPGNVKGALPDIVQKLLAARKAKRKEGAAETDPFRKALLDAEQLAYKLTANSLYGQLGSPTFKIRLQHLAASVTAYGRKQIMFAKAAIEQFYGPGAKDPRCSAVTVYGDTDSLFVNFNARDPSTGTLLTGKPAIEATMHLTEEAGKFVSRCLKPPHDFEYDKVFSPFIIFSKKRYVGNKYEESADSYYQNSMGIATKRRDYASIVKLIYGGALQILLTQKNIPEAIGFVKEKLADLVEGKMSVNMLTMSKSLRAEYASATPPAHKVLANRIKERDPGNAPASGDRVAFIYVLPPVGQVASKLQGDRVETPAFIKEKGLKIDYRFYIEHQLMNPINQLFALVAEKIPGVVQPRCGWAAATEADRLNATSSALFDGILGICDKSAGRRFAEKFFGGVTIVEAPKPRLTKVAAVAAAPKKQVTMNTYFIDKIITKAIDAGKKKAAKKTSTSPVDT